MQKYRPGIILGWRLGCGSEHVRSSHLILNQTQYHLIIIFKKYFCQIQDFKCKWFYISAPLWPIDLAATTAFCETNHNFPTMCKYSNYYFILF